MPGPNEIQEETEIRSLSKMAKFFQEKFATLPTTQYLDERLGKIEKKTNDTAEGLRSLEKRVEKIEGGSICVSAPPAPYMPFKRSAWP